MTLGVLAWLAGIVALHSMASLPDARLALAIPLLLFACWARPRWRLPLIALCGLLWATLRAALILDSSLPAALEGEELMVRGHVAALPVADTRRTRFEFRVEELVHADERHPSPGMVRLSWYRDPPRLKVGERWQLRVKLKRPRGLSNPGTFDYESWLLQHRIRATGYVRAGEDNRPLPTVGIGNPVARARQYLADRIADSLGEERMAPAIGALTIGERSGLSREQWEVLRRTGTNHLMAISGLHVGLVAGLFLFAARRAWRFSAALCRRVPAQIAGAWAGLGAAALYSAMAGFSVPTQRALIMVLVAMGAVILRRTTDLARTLALALFLVLLWDPLAVLAPGLWLSFGAVAAILWGVAGGAGQRSRWRQWGRVQWVVALGLLPALLFLFGQFSIVAPVANLLAVPWVGLLVVPLALLGASLELVQGGWGHGFLLLAAWLLDGLWQVLERMAAWQFAHWFAGQPAWWAVPLAVCGVAVLLAPRGVPARWLGLLLLVPALAVRATPPPVPGSAVFTLLDVGQGLAAVVRTERHVLLYDAGPRYGPELDAGGTVIVPYLIALGIARVDRAVISHGDSDHSGGAESVLRSLAVDELVTARSERYLGRPARGCRTVEPWEWDGVRFEFLHPRGEASGKSNDASCVLRVSAGAHALLLTGDIEKAAERDLVAAHGAALEAAVLVVPHHGSASSSSPSLLAAVRPRFALVSAGHRNRWGFPRPEVVARYRETGASVLETSRFGALRFVLDPRTDLRGPDGHRESARRYWRAP